ncbi:ABC transporter ATP-binding protein [Niallia alba]|uniref:ABC transporter ATP-binding protein n=1 Tax=Niallia alba TaxID=2729105 RepID=A0A7Y0KAB8_9BACI|nr:ABC transporter ATP-binding protein [Niallia alba]NMO78595.1 ABC transporter ATP-binding protein [Niallia alba]
MIQFQHVTKKYGKDYAVNNINLSLEEGKIYGLLGTNGSGKSTILKMIAGLVQPTNGEVLVNKKKANRRIAEEVSYLTELDRFYESFTVHDMVQFSALQFNDFQLDKAKELLEFIHLDGDKKIKHLSKGNRGRLKLVLCLARTVPILLLDEPFSGLDPLVRESIVKSLLTYIDFGKQTVVVATHEIAEVESILDNIIVLNNGDLIANLSVEDLREDKGQSIIEWMKENIN